MKIYLILIILLNYFTCLSQRGTIFFENYKCMSRCLECCDSFDVYVDLNYVDNKNFISIESISDDTTQYLYEYKIRKLTEYSNGYFIKPKRNKERVKYIFIENNVGCFIKHKHGIFKKCYITLHNNDGKISK